ncbi:hypothetical protein AB8O38_02855 [Saccharomonospora xinjiangensis]|uniref:hypothetical protein n=1 Tax=Saccharomonospora xinjiangensis TaxID=75294 RepID=UPI00350F20B7
MSHTRIAHALARLAEHQELHLPLRRTDLLGRLALRFLWRRQIKWQIETNLAVRDALEGLVEAEQQQRARIDELADRDGLVTNEQLAHEVATLRQSDQNLMAGLNQRLYSSVGRVQSQLSDLRLLLAESTEQHDTVEQRLKALEEQVAALNATARSNRLRQAQLDLLLDKLRAAGQEQPGSVADTGTDTVVESVADSVADRDSFLELAVLELLDGPVDGVRTARHPYLAVIEAASKSGATGPVLDMAPGRGEWLEIVRDAGLPYRAASENRAIRAHCAEAGLDIEDANALDLLERTPKRTLRAVTAFRYAERRKPTVLARFVELAALALQPGGVLVVETSAGSGSETDFHLDPFAVRPVHADFLRFLVEAAGFCRTEIRKAEPVAGQQPGRYSLIAWR